MKKLTLIDFATIGVCLIPFVYLIAVYPTLPGTVPLHYNHKGVPDNFGPKSSFALIIAFMQAVALGVFLLMRNIKYIDPKKLVQYSEAVYGKMGFGTAVFVSGLSIAIIYATKEGGMKIEKVLFPLMGLLFAFIGNMMNNIKPNYFAGIRTPWTLEDPDTWRVTHRLAARMWVIGGLIICLSGLVLPNSISFIFVMSVIGVMTLVPLVYSFVYFKKHQVKS
ncbi:SdpI family protein [Mucilaginibacter myungsuensis]|uniref:SdpI family protein n=1 Tax=Mucilaginibacter myungsuensis TaxID=649104 RepID=A0A929L1S9_9SPHI|nr:SdpI family protein [Mucilaginibacter myungsuensis]MBE9664690.1 SdpI family protein [Mucilaginibacter myungsuensis]MDN3601453.1 SdpI family protein [Mucilaginibacter myungsuensis]